MVRGTTQVCHRRAVPLPEIVLAGTTTRLLCASCGDRTSHDGSAAGRHVTIRAFVTQHCGCPPPPPLVRPVRSPGDVAPVSFVALVDEADGAEGGALDLVCSHCDVRDRLHPVEPVVDQMRLFVRQHQHDPG